ncbi:bromodomain adjacent to zinc finger domain protein 1A-like, partial [Homalodisca vitripennis]|uniref:bromodomain adjacent to zinc finger domain protein 1A-like n=1 Tax=Homalodisca vitripennis TaxID=197043 RepID=UPI001EE9B1DA
EWGEAVLAWPPGSLYRYEEEKLLFPPGGIKNRLYIKQFTEQVGGFWKLKAKTAEKYGISRVKFDLIFVGEAPDLSPNKKGSPNNQVKTGGSGKKEKRQESIDKYFTKKSPSKQQNSQPMDAHQKSLLQKLKEKYKVQNAKNTTLANKIANKQEAIRQKRKYTKKKLLQSSDKNSVLTEMEIKQRKQEEKLKLREQKRKKKEQVALLMKEYNRKKEDLELEDLQDLPEPLPIELRLPNELFGDFVMIMEFLHTFQETINLKDYFPAGMTLDLLERALVENEVAGPLCDIIQMLLTAIFELQEEEDDEIREDSDMRSSDWQDVADVAGDMRTKEAVRQATIAARWSQAYHRTPLNKLTLDASTVTEVLRLHLLASGGRCGDSSSKWRYQQRGGYSSLDDPGLMLRLSQPHILDSLSQIPFCDLSIGDKLAILSCLINQILTFSAVRDVIDERMDKIRQGKVELRSLHANDKRREQEAYQKLKDGEWTVEQLEKEKELLHRRKQDQNRRLRELNEENQSNQVLPLGQDRAYRRFWLFTAIPGLFVEHDDRHAGTCLPKGTPALDLGLLNGEDPEMYVKRLFEQGSNKENLLKSPTKTPITPTKTPSKASLPKTPTKGASPSKVAEDKIRRPLTCWADSLCPVHSDQGERVCWAFYQDEAAVDELIAKLNKRGMREHALQATLEDERERIVQSITKCPISRLNTNLCPTLETRKSSRNNPRYDNANLNFPPGTPSEEILESVLRDLILETEEKINDGCLGSLKVHDRKAWREAIANSSYDQQCEKLVWGGSSRNN